MLNQNQEFNLTTTPFTGNFEWKIPGPTKISRVETPGIENLGLAESNHDNEKEPQAHNSQYQQ